MLSSKPALLDQHMLWPSGPSARLHEQLDRFHIGYRRRITDLALSYPRIGQLAWTFPALLIALAVPRRLFDPELAIAAVLTGRTAKRVAKLAQIPGWMRKLPPEAFE